MTSAQLLKAYQDNYGWIDENLDYLLKEFCDKYVAVLNGEVIASGNSILDIQETLKAAPLDCSVNSVAIEFISDEPRLMLL